MFLLLFSQKIFVGIVILISHLCFCYSSHVSPLPCDASLIKSCPASLYYVPETPKTLAETASLFNVNPSVINRTVDGFLIAINCSCPADHDEFIWHVDYTVQSQDNWERVSSKFGSLVLEKSEKVLIPAQIVTLDILCGCSESKYIVSYKIEKGDTLFTVCSRFKADVNKTAELNGLENPDLIYAGDVMFIPEPAGLQNLIVLDGEDTMPRKVSKSRIYALVGGILAACTVIILVLVLVIVWNYQKGKGGRPFRAYSKGVDFMPYYHDSSPSHTKSEESMASSISSDRATIFPYHEVCSATSDFSMSLKIGQGSYGSVYLGKLRGIDVAIKQMKNTKSKEFLSELNILCNVHHTNLIELIGYAAGGTSLFLVYEYAQQGALSEHLHNLSLTGNKPLPWTTRVQIALDAARGLEYIHEHTKPYYVHRDVKTSNILLTSKFRAKIADFGLVKLLEHSSDGGTAASRIVGTFGYLAPEYVRDGYVTTKSDVYAFGVVLMELLTGQPALSRDTSPENDQYTGHRSIVDYVLSAFKDTHNPMLMLTKCIDPNLGNYHKDLLFQMALLSKDCVDDNWSRRPDMSTVVYRLSHISMCSEEWEKSESDQNKS